jgi:hypothetical protein
MELYLDFSFSPPRGSGFQPFAKRTGIHRDGLSPSITRILGMGVRDLDSWTLHIPRVRVIAHPLSIVYSCATRSGPRLDYSCLTNDNNSVEIDGLLNSGFKYPLLKCEQFGQYSRSGNHPWGANIDGSRRKIGLVQNKFHDHESSPIGYVLVL